TLESGAAPQSSWSTSASAMKTASYACVRAPRSSNRGGLERQWILPASSSTTRVSGSCRSRCSNRTRLSGWRPPAATTPYRWAGEKGFNLLTLPYMYEPDVLRNSIDHYREALVQAGHDPATREVLGKFHIYVTDSERAAVAEAGSYLHNYWRVADAQHPGRTAARRLQAAEQVARGNVIAGDPQRCIDLIQRWRDALGLTVVSGTFYFGGMQQEVALRNIRRFAAEVMPAFAKAEAVIL